PAVPGEAGRGDADDARDALEEARPTGVARDLAVDHFDRASVALEGGRDVADAEIGKERLAEMAGPGIDQRDVALAVTGLRGLGLRHEERSSEQPRLPARLENQEQSSMPRWFPRHTRPFSFVVPGTVPKWLRERSAKPLFTGSNPVRASRFLRGLLQPPARRKA